MVDIQTLEHELVLAGELNQGDSDIYIPARIRRLSDGTNLTNEFRPQLGDYVIYKNVTYRLDKLSFNILGQTETFCRAFGKRMQDTTTTDEEIGTVPYVVGEMLDVFSEFESLPEFQQEVTYRCFVKSIANPITGDVSTSYTDYTIYATVDIQDTENQLVQAGELQLGDAVVFMSSRISKEIGGTTVSPQVRPKAHDYIIFNNITYRIEKLDFPIMGSTEVFAKLYCLRMKDESTVADVTTVPFVAGEMLDLFREYMTTPEFQQTLTYRHFTISKSPISGDLNLTTYSDYTIYGTVDIENTEKNLTLAGELRTSDVVIWLPARLSETTSGIAISPQVRPTINDYVIHDGVTYRIAKIVFYIMGTDEMFAKIFGMRLSSSNPPIDWNPSYDSTFKVGGGYT